MTRTHTYISLHNAHATLFSMTLFKIAKQLINQASIHKTDVPFQIESSLYWTLLT